MTWHPKVGEWVALLRPGRVQVAMVHSVSWCGLTGDEWWLVDEAGESCGYVTHYDVETRMRPATIDEIPGNTATEEEHDAALCDALGIEPMR